MSTSTRRLLFGSALSIGAFLITLVGCASHKFTIPLPATPRPIASCEYLNVFVDPEDPLRGTGVAEKFRRVALLRAAERLPHFGLWMVEDRSQAYWRLFAEGRVNTAGNVTTRIGLSPELKLGRELFVILMGDEEFPFRGDLGGSYKDAFSGRMDSRAIRSMADRGMKWIWERESEQISFLCQARSELLEEGWDEIEELRSKLADEMKRIRRKRALTHQEKHLHLEVEEAR